MHTLRKNKVSLIRTLSTDVSFILQYVQQDNIITDREYSELKHKNHTKEDIVINLLDTLMNKGDETCCKFVDLLKREDVQETFPGAQQLFNPAPTSHNQENPVRAPDEEEDCYPMTRRPVGYCLIINNHKFEDTALIRNRKGTDIDKDALKEVFERMHFSVEERRDLSSSDILKVLTEFSVKDHSEMDAFVCCILTHGEKGAVLGIDGRPVPVRELTVPLAHCSTLTGKPKLFFIQACQGSNMHESVLRQEETEEQMKARTPSVIVATPMRETWTQGWESYKAQ
ncbi:caspase-8-like, partial [Clarias magur]